MTQIVLVPAWRRPDFLHATLTRLAQCDGIADVQVWIRIDRRCLRDTVRVARQWAGLYGWRADVLPHHRYRGNSFNVLGGFRAALEAGADLVHLVEEDVFVGRDYLAAARAAHDLCPDAFAVSLCRNQNFLAGHDPAPNDMAVYAHGTYQSLAVSFRPNRLAQVLHHARPQYFADPIGYCRQVFPDTRIPPGNAEQDGLIGRVLEHAGGRVAYAAVPRAYHAGFVGYNRAGARLPGSVEARSARLLAMSADELNAHAHSFPDHTTVDLDDDRRPLSRVVAWP